MIARLDGEIVRDLVAGHGKAFSWGIVKWLGVGAPAVYCNAMVYHSQYLVLVKLLTAIDQIPPGEDINRLPNKIDTLHP